MNIPMVLWFLTVLAKNAVLIVQKALVINLLTPIISFPRFVIKVFLGDDPYYRSTKFFPTFPHQRTIFIY